MDTAKFCRKCGVDVSDQQLAVSGQAEDIEEETRVVSRRGEEEKGRKGEGEKGREEGELFSISPTLLFVKAGYVVAALGALVLVGLARRFCGILCRLGFRFWLG